ncbi:hypothetical protein [Amycolatopsis sp. BJA-103]|uniref:hypothetical protein n=1 Tax=unclassified Amycolatopsis TaxID=2618356 RepID=UPI000C7867F9|nr:hypothetical protein [Amycolatopsis sp. BJA-103]AUI59628.1 hypothetical protein BKN51_16320 [Amycolatopsis sp. BJA-103]PNE16924.1 hypothetical protein B1H26_18185 [Amycolatopsis sp. BJA-103]
MTGINEESLDDLDRTLLRQVRELWNETDPVPVNLVEQIQFAVRLKNVELEVFRLIECGGVPAARGDERSTLLTFECSSLTIMVSVGARTDGTVRLDGWIQPPAALEIEVRTSSGSITISSDREGRFAVDRVARGMVQLIARPQGGGRTISTPAMEL